MQQCLLQLWAVAVHRDSRIDPVQCNRSRPGDPRGCFWHWWAQRDTRTTSLVPRESRAQLPGTTTTDMPRRRRTRESRREFCPRASHCTASRLCTARAGGRPASLAKTDGHGHSSAARLPGAGLPLMCHARMHV